MPTSKEIDSYPFHLYQIVESVLLTHKPVDIELANRGEAYKMRFQVYGLRSALRHTEAHPLQFEALKLSTRLNGTVLTICHADEEGSNNALARAAENL
jgi:hypothetical protein